MSIPLNDTRQLMINLMYLVLMALLALNVSAKIFKAFEKVDHSLERSNDKLDESNDLVAPEVKKRAQKDESYQVYADRVDPVRQLSSEFVAYVQDVEDEIIDESGDRSGAVDEGDYIERYGHMELKGKKDKDATTRLLVGDVNDPNDALGDQLKEKIEEVRTRFLEYVDEDDRAEFEQNIALNIQDDLDAIEEDPDILSWSQYNFFQMPVQAVLPLFEKLRNDAKSTEATILNYFLKKVGGEEIEFKKFKVVSSPKKTYVIQGETFETDVFLSAAAGETSNTGISIRVNGQSVPTEDGVATFKQQATSTGVKKYTAAITVTNPVTGESETYDAEFEYEVGLRSVSVSADKMNVFYIGVENPVSVAAAGVPSHTLRVSASGAGGLSLKPAGKGQYTATVTTPTKISEFAYVVVSGEGLQSTRFPFRVKRIPDPKAMLGNQSSGQMGNGEFKAQGGVLAILENFDFDARCNIAGFEITRIAKRSDPISNINRGPSYDEKSMRLVQMATPGDTYFFDNVRARCPGDPASRQINSMVFKIR